MNDSEKYYILFMDFIDKPSTEIVFFVLIKYCNGEYHHCLNNFKSLANKKLLYLIIPEITFIATFSNTDIAFEISEEIFNKLNLACYNYRKWYEVRDNYIEIFTYNKKAEIIRLHE